LIFISKNNRSNQFLLRFNQVDKEKNFSIETFFLFGRLLGPLLTSRDSLVLPSCGHQDSSCTGASAKPSRTTYYATIFVVVVARSAGGQPSEWPSGFLFNSPLCTFLAVRSVVRRLEFNVDDGRPGTATIGTS
jgi:hypothetical protein